MKRKRGAKFGEEWTCRLKIGISNLTNFDPSTQKVSKIFILMGSFWAKYILFELKRYRGVIFHETEEGCKTWRGIDLLFQNWHKKFGKFWSEHFKSQKKKKKKCFNWVLVTKKYIASATKVQVSYLAWHWGVMQILKKNWVVVWNKTWEFGKFSPECQNWNFDGVLWPN